MRAGLTTVVAGGALLALTLMGPPSAGAQALNADECKCQTASGKAQGKFAAAKAKCVSKCEAGERKGTNPGTDCVPPYAGTTAECVTKAEGKAAAKETKCKDCPECYSGGDCTLDGTNRTAETEGDVDLFVPLIFCDDTPSDDDLNDDEATCQQQQAKNLGKFAAAKANCYAKCRKKECKGTPVGSCTPPASDPDTQACIAKAEAKCVDKLTTACPDPPECNALTAAQLCALAEAAVDGNDASTYCASPSGAFVE